MLRRFRGIRNTHCLWGVALRLLGQQDGGGGDGEVVGDVLSAS